MAIAKIDQRLKEPPPPPPPPGVGPLLEPPPEDDELLEELDEEELLLLEDEPEEEELLDDEPLAAPKEITFIEYDAKVVLKLLPGMLRVDEATSMEEPVPPD